MNIHEYQAKDLLARYGVAVPKGIVATNPAQVKDAVKRLGGRAIVKAQVHAGGRGKAGGVKIVKSADDAVAFAVRLLGKKFVTVQTGPVGVPIERLLVEELLDIEREIYFSTVVDGTAALPVIVASTKGGMDIEQVSRESPQDILFVKGDPLLGFGNYKVRQLARRLGFEGDLYKTAVSTIGKLCRLAEELECSLLELNPLVVTKKGDLIAGDAKLVIEDDALPRHPELVKFHDPGQLNTLERRAAEVGLAYVKLDGGKVGCMVNGAGLAMATMDITLRVGAAPANFLDIGGSAQQEHIERAFKILIADGDVEVVLINLFAGIARADIVATAVVNAVRESGSTLPIVAAIRGTNYENGIAIFKRSGLNVRLAANLNDAAQCLKDVLG